ncbi:WD40 repeat domain-containing protein [Prosthecobacter sp.]|uniref:WD40 repeat domain-containing protein n=1 Tax=Prosthecobacter sp. TaxID=1965333 RepID=UPI003784E40E
MKLTRTKQYELPFGVMGLAATPDGSQVYAACMDGSVHAVEMATGKTEVFEKKHDAYGSGCVLLPDGRTLISAGYDGVLLWHDVATRKCVREVKAHAFWSWQMALSPDGKRVASVTGQYLPGGWKYEPAAETEPSVKVYDTATGALVASYGHTPPVLSCAFSPDSRHLAAANMMGEVRVWDTQAAQGAESGKPVAQWTSPDFTSWGTTKSHHFSGGIYSLAFSPDGNVLVGCGMGPMGDPMAGNGKMTWQRWDWRAGKKLDQIKDGQHGSGLMETLAWHPEGKHFLMGGRQAQGTWNVAVFSAADGSLVTSLDSKSRLTRARFTADGKGLVASVIVGPGKVKAGQPWAAMGRVQMYSVEV